LKQLLVPSCLHVAAPSRPSRARGLKQAFQRREGKHHDVAPFAGAWIETNIVPEKETYGAVAPFAGAWIETAVIDIVYPI